MPEISNETRTMNKRKNYLSQFNEKRQEKREYEFLPATLEVLERPPAPFSRFMLIFVIALTSFILGWASLTEMDIVVSGMGVVVPKGKVKIVQSLESAIVTAIHIRDGQIVKEGEPLITMDNTESRADVETISNELTEVSLTIARLNAQIEEDPTLFIPPPQAGSKNIALHRKLLLQSLAAETEKKTTLELEIQRCRAERESIRSNMKRLTEALPLSLEMHNRKSALAKRKLVPDAELLQARMELNNIKHNLLSAKNRLVEVDSRLSRAMKEKELVKTEYQRDLLSKLAEMNSRQENLQRQLAKAKNRQNHFSLLAPADGIVQQLAIHTVGGVVTAAQPLMVIVPLESGLEIEGKILNKDIGFIRPGQEVSIKVAAYPFTRYGDLKGKIEWVAGDAVIDQQMGPIYPFRVSVSNYLLPNIINGRQGKINPGMTVTTDIKVGRRRVIQYFLGPIMRYRDKSLREI
ncbi:HlyD family type I secretion periplasmic adaptor subunit [Desulfomarina profundi]|uniref:HlyD family type I secretion periplasmic adaptor subunit n=1 Tax=Desulfomarina profundi TaxID=2772557 RepID=A0A8D5FKR0_9BACT|nr:HlyD family type I secretion periplasmic adaptor subunit [Desulfomarina profundi]BCL62386.1 HlyD family type I secretion periplasmic adaptor subunit [Desulfomarina profundi]